MNPTVPQGNDAQFGLPAIPPLPNGAPANPVAPSGAGGLQPTAAAPSDSSDLLTNAIAEAKRIEQQYQANPYMQNQALQQLKTSYLNARYHTDIKLTQN